MSELSSLLTKGLCRAVLAIYLMPALHILLTCQLAIVSRKQYLQEHKAGDQYPATAIVNHVVPPQAGLVDNLWNLVRHPWITGYNLVSSLSATLGASSGEPVNDTTSSDGEETFLAYSWWLLNEGWKPFAAQVEAIVKRKSRG